MTDMSDIFATLIFIGAVIGTVMLLQAYFISYTGGVQTPMENMEALQAAYAVDSCFVSLGQKEYVTSDFLDQYNRKFVGEENFCDIAYPPIYAKVTDVENGNEWTFDRPTGAALESFFGSTRLWLKNKILPWTKSRESSKPSHSIFIPIIYDKVTGFARDSIVFGGGRRYVIVFSGVADKALFGKSDVNLEVYPIETYGKDVSGMGVMEINTIDDINKLKDQLKGIQPGTEKKIVVVNHLLNVQASDITDDSLKLAAGQDMCGNSASQLLCITGHEREIHGGRLYVEI
jgi:hypothetical protein